MALVQLGSFHSYPGIPLQTAFDGFFAECVWHYQNASDTVQAEGTALYGGEAVRCQLNFSVKDDGSFTLTGVIMKNQGNGKTTTLTKEQISSLIAAVFQGDIPAVPPGHGFRETTGRETMPQQEQPAKNVCASCKGSGQCQVCVYGECLVCYGDREVACSRCSGSGDCTRCLGQGGKYTSILGELKWVDCTQCKSSGDCTGCGGERMIPCRACGGTGECSRCHGDLICPYCGGED